ncbi:MAG: hypothetical protein JWP97_4394 [Labilithrix sp.]|nr:hypothetical protein [Labilithrix sp.]
MGARGKRRAWAALVPLLVAGLLTRTGAARADDDEDLAGLLDQKIVSGASKTDELARDAPGTTQVITAEDIRRYGIRSIAEAIDFLGMGLVTQNPLHSVEIGGRGVLLTSDFGNHVLLVVDGHTYNEPWDGTAYFEQGAGIPLELIDHIELVLGPGAVLYGGNAMFGVVNVVTKRAASYEGAHAVVEGSVSPQQGRNGAISSFAPGDLGGSYRLGAGIGHELTLFGRPAQLTAQLEMYRQDGPSFDWAPQATKNEQGGPKDFGPRAPLGSWGGRTSHQYTTAVPTLYARLELGDLSFMFRATSYKRRTPTQGFDQSDTDFDEPRSFEQDRFLSADVRYRKQLARRFTLSVRGYADAYDYQQNLYNTDGSDCEFEVAGHCLTISRGHSRWLGAETQGTFDWTGAGTLTTLVGVDTRLRNVGNEYDIVEADTGRLADVTSKKEVTELVWAAYAQQRLTPMPFVHLNAGLRYDHDPRGVERLSPRAAAAFDVWRDGVMKVSYSEAFRAPTFYEAFFTSPDQKANPDLHAESVKGLEASVEQRFGRHSLLFGAFRTWWDDLLALRSINAEEYAYENVSRIDNYGYNGRAEGAFGPLHYGVSVTGAYTRRTTPDGTQPLPVAPQLFGNARVAYVGRGSWPTLALATTFVGKRPADRAYDGNFTSFPAAPASAEIRLTLSQRVPFVPGLSYRLASSFTTGTVVPYVGGPNQSYEAGDPTRGPALLTPTLRFVTFGTLQYDLPL